MFAEEEWKPFVAPDYWTGLTSKGCPLAKGYVVGHIVGRGCFPIFARGKARRGKTKERADRAHERFTACYRKTQEVSRWFRLYADAMRHPKVASLTDAQFRLWVELLAVASENNGFIPSEQTLKHVLKRRLDHLSRGLKDLLRARLIALLRDGYEPHGWNERQYKSDTSTDRVQKHREKRNVSVTPPDTEADTESDTERLEPNGSCASAITADTLKPEHFVQSWNEKARSYGLPAIRNLTPERRTKLKARIAGYSLDDFREVLAAIDQSPFLRGERAWGGATFDWITKKGNFQKVLEGNYNG